MARKDQTAKRTAHPHAKGPKVKAEFQSALLPEPLRVSAEDNAGEVRAVELDEHPFFVATLFQPERAALRDRLPPLVHAFVQSAAICRSGTVARAT